MAAAAPDHSLGFFSAVFSRLRAASSAWRRKRSNDADARETQLGKEATVRSRLARRAGAVRRFGRNLAFVSFNLEVLLFVYAFWRSRRRNLNWRQPLQALPMLVIPALATLIYAVFVRFTRTLDLKDKKTLQRLEQQHHSVQRGSGSHQNQQNSVEKCDPVDDAINFSSETDPAPAETSKLGKHHRPSINLRDDGGGDDCWGHSKDFQPIRSNGLRRRTFTIEKTHITNSSAFRQLSNWPTEHLSDDPGDPNHMEGTAEHHSNSGADVAENGVACSTAQINSSLPGCSAAHIISNATDHADLSSSMSCPKSSRGLAEEDAVQTALTGPKSGLPDVAELHHEGVENEPSKFHVSEDSRMPFISEEELLVSSNAVENIEHHSGTSGFTLCSQEMEKEDVAGGLFYIKVSPVLSLLSSPELVVEGGKDASEKESCELDQKEENNVAVNSEDEALLGKPVVNTAELDNGTSGFSLRAQDSNMMEVPAIVNISSVIPESNYPTSAELPAEDGEDCKDAGTSDVHLPEQNGQEELSDPLVVDSFEDLFATSEFLLRTVVAEMTEVLDAVQEGLSEGASDHQNAVVASSDDGGDTENAISNSVFVQLIPEANIMEALQDVENEEPLASKGGDYGSKDVNFALLDTSISLNEFTNAKSWTDNAGCSPCITESNRTESLHDGKQALPKTSESANLGLEESLISLDQEINLEIFSLYSRSSSCVSEVNMTETLRSATFPALENDNDFSFDETTSMMVANVSHAENCTNNARSAEFIPEIDMTETLYVGKEAPSRLEHEVYSNSDISLKAPDVANVVEKFDNSLDLLLWSFDPVVDASEGLQADQGFSKLQPENDTTFVNVETNVTTKEVNSDGVYATNIFGDLQNRKETSIDASGSAKVSKSHSQIVSPEAQPQDPLIFKDSLFLLSAEVKLIESLEGDQGETDQQQDETNVVSEDMYIVCQGSISEKRPNNLGCQHISDANTTKTLQGTERLPSGIFHDGIFGIAGTSVSLDGGNDTDNSSADSGSEMHTAQNNTVVLLGLPKPETAMVSISRCEVDGAEKNGSDSICDEAAMTGAIQGVNKSPSQSQDELPGTYVSTDRANHPEYSRPSSSVPDDNSIELLAAGQERPLDRKYEIPSSFQKTSPSENLSNNLVCASHTSKSVTFSVKEFPGPSLEDVDGFDMVSTDEQANKSIKENALSCEQIARTRAEVNCNESQDFTEASKLNCTEASESVSEVFFDPEHHGPEVVLSQVGMPFFIDEGEETEKNLGSSSTACASSYHDISILETLRVLPVSAGSEKGFLEGSKVCEWHCTDKDPKDLKVEDLKDNVEDLNEDHEDSP